MFNHTRQMVGEFKKMFKKNNYLFQIHFESDTSGPIRHTDKVLAKVEAVL